MDAVLKFSEIFTALEFKKSDINHAEFYALLLLAFLLFFLIFEKKFSQKISKNTEFTHRMHGFDHFGWRACARRHCRWLPHSRWTRRCRRARSPVATARGRSQQMGALTPYLVWRGPWHELVRGFFGWRGLRGPKKSGKICENLKKIHPNFGGQFLWNP